MPVVNGCTIIARNYLPHARVLARSLAEQHPEAEFTVLVIDDRGEGGHDEPFTVLSPYDIGLDPSAVHRMAMIYDIKEFATAVKPALLRTLIERSQSEVTYFDPDIQIFRPLADVASLARRHGIVLTPHITSPLPRDDRLPSEEMILRAGVYNLGFIAVGAAATDFLNWWHERLARDCIVAVEEGLFVDQRWIDFVPGLFDYAVLRDPTCNVAYWNLSHRRLAWENDHWSVNGKPLRFFHFSGFDPDTPGALSAHMGTVPRIILAEQPDLKRLCAEYARLLRACGYGGNGSIPYRFDRLPNGMQIDGTLRRVTRRALVTAERSDEAAAPDPFDPSTVEDFLDWLREPIRSRRLSRYLAALYDERADLRVAFPDASGADRARFLEWARETASRREEVRPELVDLAVAAPAARGRRRVGWERTETRLRNMADEHPSVRRAKPLYRQLRRLARHGQTPTPAGRPPTSPRAAPRHLLPGVNVAGYLRAELGVGEAARRLVRGLEKANVPHGTLVYDRTVSRQLHPFEQREPNNSFLFDTNLICVNADELSNFRSDIGAEFFAGRYSIGVWFWEVSRFPDVFKGAFDFIDEVWVASDFVRAAVSAATDKPVLTVPLPIDEPHPPVLSRAALNLPERFLFLFGFDFLSVFERKNPLGLIDAFGRAFSPGEGPVLLIKSINGDRDPASMERLRERAAEHPDVHVVDGYVSAAERDALVAACDCYVSLHRSEGYGLTMAEAMALGKPVIATGYSGNLAFMDETNSHLVPYTLTAIPPGCGPYPTDAEWAEPNVAAAAELMRRVWERPEEARFLGERAREDVVLRHSVSKTGLFMSERFQQIRARDTAAERERPMPGSALVGGRRLAPKTITRRLLRRLLWPQLLEQHTVDEMLAAAVRQTDAATGNLREESFGLQEHVTVLQQQASSLERHVSALQPAVAALDERLSTMAVELHERARLVDLSPKPYIADTSLLETTDEAGRPAIGFSTTNPTPSRDAPYRAFEDIFRGSEDFIRDRQRFYVPLLADRSPVLDIGCGRGELLQLLHEAGVPASGVDLDAGMVARCREKGLDVTLGDLNDRLRTVDEATLGAVFSAQVIEHLSYEQLLEYHELAYRALEPGGLFVNETVNPHAFPAFKMFWLDLTHRSPIYPEVGVALCRIVGFASARVLFPNGTGSPEEDRITQGEYAIVAMKPSEG
jgi:glycosyltransferase involved in cell wall biosynthesis/SAM-dependent methyltransferase